MTRTAPAGFVSLVVFGGAFVERQAAGRGEPCGLLLAVLGSQGIDAVEDL
jgi:hypothetical protein